MQTMASHTCRAPFAASANTSAHAVAELPHCALKEGATSRSALATSGPLVASSGTLLTPLNGPSARTGTRDAQFQSDKTIKSGKTEELNTLVAKGATWPKREGGGGGGRDALEGGEATPPPGRAAYAQPLPP